MFLLVLPRRRAPWLCEYAFLVEPVAWWSPRSAHILVRSFTPVLPGLYFSFFAGALVLHRELAAHRAVPHGHDRHDPHPQPSP